MTGVQTCALPIYRRGSEITELIEGISKFAQIVEPRRRVELIKEDLSDNRILEAAVEGEADYIISGDKKHILSLKKFERVEIVSAQEFLNTFYKKN